MKAIEDIKAFVVDLLAEGDALMKTQFQDHYGSEYVNHQAYHKFLAGFRLLLTRLSPYGATWNSVLPATNENYVVFAMQVQGCLQAIDESLKKGRLSTVQELVTSEVLSDLLEQAEVLLTARYQRAAAIILRTILEERLRKLCESNRCLPTATKPTIEHYKQALYSATVIDKIVLKKIDWMAGVGNSAAHNLPEYRDEDVPTLYKDALDFLSRFSP